MDFDTSITLRLTPALTEEGFWNLQDALIETETVGVADATLAGAPAGLVEVEHFIRASSAAHALALAETAIRVACESQGLQPEFLDVHVRSQELAPVAA